METECLEEPLIRSHGYVSRGFLLCAAVVFTVLVLQWSLNSGRLAHDSTYDDVQYLTDGLKRLQILYQQGALPFFRHWAANPPHSPWSSTLAIIGFALFGIHDWAPYAMNGLLVFAIFLFCERILKTVAWPLRLLAVLLMVFTPFMVVAVNEFRPDLAVAFFTAAAVFCAVSGAFAESGERAKRYARIGGCLLGAALLAKPSFFLHTALMGFCAMGVLLAGRIYAEKGSSANRGTVWRAAVEFICLALLMALPYYLLSWQHVINYFWNNAVSADSDVWKIKGNLFNTVDFYLVSGPAAAMTGVFAFLYCALIGLGIVVRLVRREWPRVLVPVLLSGFAGASLGVMLLGHMRNPFFGLSYQFILFFTAFGELAYLWKSPQYRYLVAALMVATVFAQFQRGLLHPHLKNFGSRLTLTRNSANNKILAELQTAVKQTKAATLPYKVFVTFAGEVNSSSMQWLAKKMHANFTFFGYHRSSDLNLYRNTIQSSDFVVLPSADASGVYQWLPSFTIQQEVREVVNEQPSLKKIAEIPLEDFGAQGTLILFQNTAKDEVSAKQKLEKEK